MKTLNIPSFVKTHITNRPKSFFEQDIINRQDDLNKEINNKTVLVIGGGGTIGSNYIKSILPFQPARVVVIDTNENGLTELVRDVRSTPGLFVPKEFITYPVNLGDRIFEKIYNFYKPFNIIANFAAHKHVRSEKDVFSVEAMIQNNVFYAYRLLKMIEEDKPSHFFCVSTDKAANPVNIMGASKKLMEDVVMDFSSVLPCTTARFANVAFSNGSLLDGFIQRMMKNQPLSVPSDVKRYFVSPQESGDICMLACMLGKSGEIFFPKLKEDQLTSFLSITEKFLQVNGYTLDRCQSEQEAKEKSLLLNENSTSYPVYVFDSNTTGEKLFEEFYTDNEDVHFTLFEALGVIRNAAKEKAYNTAEAIQQLEQLFAGSNVDKHQVVEVLSTYIPTFQHEEKGITLDQKM